MIASLVVLNAILMLIVFGAKLALEECKENITTKYWDIRNRQTKVETVNESYRQQIKSMQYRIGKLAEANRNMRRRVAVLENPSPKYPVHPLATGTTYTSVINNESK
jgi:hypothetical protein